MTEKKTQGVRSRRKSGCLAAGLVSLAVLAALALSYRCWLTALASALVVDEPPGYADAVVAVSGNHFRRLRAMELYRQGYAGLLIFNVSDTTYYFGLAVDPAASVREEACRQGIPGDSMVINRNIGSTFEDALAAAETARRLGLKSLLVVTSSFSSRRARYAYRKATEGLGLELRFCCVPPETEKMSLESWWTRERELVTVVNEYLKLVLYCLKYR
ncbi:MAG: YdcF family protein [Candidatus Glassbacteria bacterium]|nr:YdcF family protein [Candidatus Glassbacteria bacterium]